MVTSSLLKKKKKKNIKEKIHTKILLFTKIDENSKHECLFT